MTGFDIESEIKSKAPKIKNYKDMEIGEIANIYWDNGTILMEREKISEDTVKDTSFYPETECIHSKSLTRKFINGFGQEMGTPMGKIQYWYVPDKEGNQQLYHETICGNNGEVKKDTIWYPDGKIAIQTEGSEEISTIVWDTEGNIIGSQYNEWKTKQQINIQCYNVNKEMFDNRYN